ncbi:MAG: PCMD domain-containing protein, partial [Muribaculaceae bacterium]|nr:PCMD domain-containing protein [Muribaculaceae bacterium]
PLDYRRADANASYLVINCSASYWGDYFTGGPSVMYLDDFEFIYE